MPYAEARKHVTHPVACIDCHDPETMALRVTRPGFIEGIRALKASQGVKDYDVNTDGHAAGDAHLRLRPVPRRVLLQGPGEAAHLSVGQGPQGRPDLAYYDEVGFKDWTHAETGAPVLKAQHPEFEMWNQGIHARSGVACADCHMPYKREGALKISDHHVRSPLLNINRACQTCHKWSRGRAAGARRDDPGAHVDLRNRAMDALVALIADIKAAQGSGRAGRAADRRARVPAHGAVLPRLRRGGELEGLPRAAGGRAHPGRVDRLLAAGTVGSAARAGACFRAATR